MNKKGQLSFFTASEVSIIIKFLNNQVNHKLKGINFFRKNETKNNLYPTSTSRSSWTATRPKFLLEPQPINLFFYYSQLRPLQLLATWSHWQLQLQLPFPAFSLHLPHCIASSAQLVQRTDTPRHWPRAKKSMLLSMGWYSTIPGSVWPGCMVVYRVSRSIMRGALQNAPILAVWCRRYFPGDKVESWVKMYKLTSYLYRSLLPSLLWDLFQSSAPACRPGCLEWPSPWWAWPGQGIDPLPGTLALPVHWGTPTPTHQG